MRGTPMVKVISLAAASRCLAAARSPRRSASQPPTPRRTSRGCDYGTHPQRHHRARHQHRSSREPLRSRTRRSAAGWRQEGRVPVGHAARHRQRRPAARDLAEEDYNVVVISGGDSQGTVGLRGRLPQHGLPGHRPAAAVRDRGRSADPSGTCEGGAFAIPFNYSAIDFEVDQAAYLAGVIARPRVARPPRHHQRHARTAASATATSRGSSWEPRASNPDIDVEVAYLADDEEVAFDDPTSAKTFAKAFIDVYEPDVILPARRGADHEASSRRPARPASRGGHGHRRLDHLPGARGVHPHEHHQGLRVRRARVDLPVRQPDARTGVAAGALRRPRRRH